ncbi:hypothetical protein HGM15179_016766 [Zosterops borbonicus]|uniref:Uncharacterized protein n=1 Tax=Zosterops borbonicus TaxID=364589 RepID=A0A8K1LDZ9_9PASS|nr:hypothetical protein HGM15179_016766 [Zosterops borbonicus]
MSVDTKFGGATTAGGCPSPEATFLQDFPVCAWRIPGSLRLEKLSKVTESKLFPNPHFVTSATPSHSLDTARIGDSKPPVPIPDQPFHEEIPPEKRRSSTWIFLFTFPCFLSVVV